MPAGSSVIFSRGNRDLLFWTYLSSDDDDPPVATAFWGTTNGGTDPAAWQHSKTHADPWPIGSPPVPHGTFISGLSPATSYYFSVRVVNGSGTAWCALISAPVATLANPDVSAVANPMPIVSGRAGTQDFHNANYLSKDFNGLILKQPLGSPWVLTPEAFQGVYQPGESAIPYYGVNEATLAADDWTATWSAPPAFSYDETVVHPPSSQILLGGVCLTPMHLGSNDDPAPTEAWVLKRGLYEISLDVTAASSATITLKGLPIRVRTLPDTDQWRPFWSESVSAGATHFDILLPLRVVPFWYVAIYSSVAGASVSVTASSAAPE